MFLPNQCIIYDGHRLRKHCWLTVFVCVWVSIVIYRSNKQHFINRARFFQTIGMPAALLLELSSLNGSLVICETTLLSYNTHGGWVNGQLDWLNRVRALSTTIRIGVNWCKMNPYDVIRIFDSCDSLWKRILLFRNFLIPNCGQSNFTFMAIVLYQIWVRSVTRFDWPEHESKQLPKWFASVWRFSCNGKRFQPLFHHYFHFLVQSFKEVNRDNLFLLISLQ